MTDIAAATELTELVASVLGNPGLRAKAEIAVVGDVLGETDWVSGPGDDGAVLALPEGPMVIACGEALFPPFVRADPWGAGFAAVLTNVNDLAAMGAEPLGIVDTVVGTEELARSALAGMREAARLYRAPIVGGHLTIHDGEPAISAFGVGSTHASPAVGDQRLRRTVAGGRRRAGRRDAHGLPVLPRLRAQGRALRPGRAAAVPAGA